MYILYCTVCLYILTDRLQVALILAPSSVKGTQVSTLPMLRDAREDVSLTVGRPIDSRILQRQGEWYTRECQVVAANKSGDPKTTNGKVEFCSSKSDQVLRKFGLVKDGFRNGFLGCPKLGKIPAAPFGSPQGTIWIWGTNMSICGNLQIMVIVLSVLLITPWVLNCSLSSHGFVEWFALALLPVRCGFLHGGAAAERCGTGFGDEHPGSDVKTTIGTQFAIEEMTLTYGRVNIYIYMCIYIYMYIYICIYIYASISLPGPERNDGLPKSSSQVVATWPCALRPQGGDIPGVCRGLRITLLPTRLDMKAFSLISP